MTQSKSKLTLIEVLAKTTYQVQITKSSNKEFDRPIAFGSGFLVNYKNELIFVTASKSKCLFVISLGGRLDDFDRALLEMAKSEVEKRH